MAVDDGNRDDNLERQPQLARLLQAAGGEEPPAALDAAVLAAARREVSARPQVVGGGGEAATPVPRQKRNWYVPLSIAAVLVMSVSLVTLVQQEKGDELTQPPRVTKESAPAAVAAPPVAEPKPAELPRDAVAAKPDETLRDVAPVITSKVEAEKRSQTVPPAVAESSDSYAQKQRNEAAQRDAAAEGVKPLAKAASPAAPPAPVRPDAPAAVAADRPAAVMSRKLGAPETGAAAGAAASNASVTATRREAAGSQRERAPVDARQEMDAAGVARDRLRSTVGGAERASGSTASNPGAAASPPVASPPSRESKVMAEPFPAPAAPPPAAEGRIAAPAPASAAKAVQQRSGPQQMTHPAWFTELDNQPPEKWLERLAQFKRDGRQAEADEVMSEFRRRFPDHPAGAR